MASLAPGASAAEIEDEIAFQQVLINSLDRDSDDYEYRFKELEGQVQELQARLAEAQTSPRRQQEQGSSMYGSSPTQQQHFSTTHGTKRPIWSLADESDRASKRHTPSPLPPGVFDHSERARMRQYAAEAAIRRQTEQHKLDEEMARKISQSWSSEAARAGPSTQSTHPVYQSTINPDGRVLPSIRPLLNESRSNSSQTSSGTPEQNLPRIKPEPHHSTDIAHRVRHVSSDVVDLTADSDDERTTLPPHRYMQPPPAVVPSSSRAEFPSLASWPSVPGAYPGGAYPGLPNGAPMSPMTPYEMQLRAANPQYRAQEAQRAAYLQRIQASAQNTLQRARDMSGNFTSQLGQLTNLINGSQSNPYQFYGRDDDDDDDDLVYQGSSYRAPPRLDPYAGQADLWRTRYEQLEQYNPEKTKEELDALLLNIRPDEELPDHLLVATPEAMTIKLHKYQELGLTWLQKSEDGSNKGGILADDMGLGKTIQMISLMVTRKSEDARCKTNLIIAPVALLRQWKQEIESKVKGRHALSVFIHHGQSKKHHYRDLQVYDVVITTFGSIAAELKRHEKFALRKANDPQVRPLKDEQCALLDPDARWYRVILDEAQCIKNKSTQTAKAAFMLNATYRWCMTGTPMMNNVSELYSLINFLRIKPYCSWEKFNLDFARPLKTNSDDARDAAMKKLQVLCKAIMLRRTKKSEYRGKPILVLPERTTEVDHALFDEDEQNLYTSLEQRTQITFNRYLRQGSVGRSYSAILVLLLRLRQACCHPHLIKDFSVGAAADLSDEALLDLARELSESVVTRIKASEGNFECPICMDACVNPAIFIPCGHDTCRDCYVKLADPSAAIREGNENGAKARCPHCRGDIDPKRITDFVSFKRVHMPELLTADEKAQFGPVDDGTETESEADSETESEFEDKTLGGFIVKDDAGQDSETESEAEEADAGEELDDLVSTKKPSKNAAKSGKSKKSKGKGKAKAKGKKQLTLSELKKLASRNVKARRKYLRRLREDYQDSAKIRKMMELLHSIINAPEDEEIHDKKPFDIKKSGEKILIFSQWTSLLDFCEIEIDRQGWGYRRYDGSMNAKMRADAVDDFKDSKKDVRIMLVSLKAGNAGLNLNVASQVIILDPFWNPYIEDQAIDRAHRIGQTRPVKVHRVLVENTVEDRILQLQEGKRKIIETALDEQAASQLSRLGARELAYLFGITRSVNEQVNYQEASR